MSHYKFTSRGVETESLIDTGALITCISYEFFKKHEARFAQFPQLPVANMQARGFTGEKSFRLKIQLFIPVKINDLEAEIIAYVVPGLIKSCIFGIDSQKVFGVLIDVKDDRIHFRLGEKKTSIKYDNVEITEGQTEQVNALYREIEVGSSEEYADD